MTDPSADVDVETPEADQLDQQRAVVPELPVEEGSQTEAADGDLADQARPAVPLDELDEEEPV